MTVGTAAETIEMTWARTIVLFQLEKSCSCAFFQIVQGMRWENSDRHMLAEVFVGSELTVFGSMVVNEVEVN